MIRGEVNVEKLIVKYRDTDTGIRLASLRVNGRSLSIEQFEMIPEEPLAGEPLGWVNWHGEACEGREPADHLHVLWINGDGELRTSTVPCGERWKGLPQIYIGI